MALNNAEQAASAAVPTFMARGEWEKVYGDGPARLRSGSDKRLSVTVGPLSAVVYRAKDRIPRSQRAPGASLVVPATGRDRLEVRADVAGDSFYEVTFLARTGHGPWRDIGTDDNAPYRVFHDVADVAPGTRVQYRAVVLDNAGHTRSSRRARSTTVAPPAITLEAPERGPARARDGRGARDRGARARDYVVRVRALGERRPVHDASAPTTRRRPTPAFDDTTACLTARG